MVVAIEGMDGSGKSTVAENIAKKIGFKHESQRITSILKTDPKDFSDFVKTIRKSDNKKLSFWFYTFRCMLDNENKQDSIVERCMLSTYYFENKNISENDMDYAMSLGVVADITFLLYASSDTRKQRIYKRNPNDIDLNSNEALSDGYKEMLDTAKKYNIPYVGINTENLTEEEVTIICSEIIQKYRNMEDKKEEFLSKMNEKYGFDSIYYNKKESKGSLKLCKINMT